MVQLQLIAIDDANITTNDITVKPGAKVHVVDRYFSWESAAKMLAEKINTDSLDTENYYVKLVEEK